MSKKSFLCVILLTALTISVFFLCFYFADNAQKQLPNITQLNYNQKSDHMPKTIESIESMSERISLEYMSFCSEQNEATVKDQTVTPILTTENYFDIYKVNVNGSGITEENISNKDKVAVIGSSLALKLFLSTDAVGKTIEINNTEYKICGVFQEDDDFINEISGDGKQRVYIPYTCYNGYEKSHIDTLAYDNSVSTAPLIEQMDLSQYYPTNLSEKFKVIETFKHIVLLLVFITTCIIALKIWFYLCKRFICNIREDLKENYLFKSVRKIPIQYILLIITALGIPLVLLLIFINSDFSIYIAAKYIPYDNLFDVSYYMDVIKENVHEVNSLSVIGNTYLLNLYKNSFNVTAWLTVIFIILFVITVSRICSIITKIFSRFIDRT